MIFGNPDMKLRFGQIGHVTGKGAGVLMKALAHQDPSHVGPPLAVEGSVGVTFFIGKLMMYAVRGDPENRSTFEGKGCADGQEIFHPFWSFVSAMSEQAMVAHADAEAARNPPQEAGNEKCLPGKEEQRCNCADVKGPHKNGRDPVNFVVLAIAFKRCDFQVVLPGSDINGPIGRLKAGLESGCNTCVIARRSALRW